MDKREIKIAIIDSGISKNKVSHQVVDVNLFSYCNMEDNLDHGQNCALIIDTINSNQIVIYNIKVCDSSVSTSPRKIIQAIRWCIDNNIDVINISIGTNDYSSYYEFQKICDEAYSRQITIVASAGNMGEVLFPAYNSHVVGVSIANIQKESILYIDNEPISYYCSPFYENLFFTSYACANMTRIISEELLHVLDNNRDPHHLLRNRIIGDKNNCQNYIYRHTLPFKYNIQPSITLSRTDCHYQTSSFLFVGTLQEKKILSKYRESIIITIKKVVSTVVDNSVYSIGDCQIIPETSIEDSGCILIGGIPGPCLNAVKEKNPNAHFFSVCPIGDNRLSKFIIPLSCSHSCSDSFPILFNESCKKQLFINLTDEWIHEFEILTHKYLQQHSGVLMTDDDFVALFGAERIPKDMNISTNCRTIKSAVDWYCRNGITTMALCLHCSPQNNYWNYDEECNNYINYLISTISSYCPDDICFVVDQFTSFDTMSKYKHIFQELCGSATISILLFDNKLISSRIDYIPDSLKFLYEQNMKKLDDQTVSQWSQCERNTFIVKTDSDFPTIINELFEDE